ncbi:MAG TPA: hypothetical protein ENI85_05495 [Deltaproteobacteria bacterium]|nr:hypothetical protein [Deltaproteobacteria bacterium]
MLGWLGLAIVGVTGWLWIRLIRNVAVPRRRAPYMASFLAGGALGLAAILQGGGLAGSIAGGIALTIALFFSLFRSLSAQKRTEPVVGVGDPILTFSAPDETGADFDLASLAGRPFLLKFFRGHW